MRFFKIRVLNRRWFRGLLFDVESGKKEDCFNSGHILEDDYEIYVNEDDIMELNSYSGKAIDFRKKGLVGGIDYESERNSGYLHIKTEKARKAVKSGIVSTSKEKGVCGDRLKMDFKEMRFGTINLKHAVCANLGLNGTEFHGQSFTMTGEDFDKLVQEITVCDLTK